MAGTDAGLEGRKGAARSSRIPGIGPGPAALAIEEPQLVVNAVRLADRDAGLMMLVVLLLALLLLGCEVPQHPVDRRDLKQNQSDD